jgi:hypothetical protein
MSLGAMLTASSLSSAASAKMLHDLGDDDQG